MTAVASRKLEKVLPPDKMDTSHTWSVGNVKESEEEVMMRQKRTGGKNKVVSHTELAKYFHLPIDVAAKELKMCVTVLKKQCRLHGVKRWPHRKLRALDKLSQKLQREEALATDPEFYNIELQSLREQKKEVMNTGTAKQNDGVEPLPRPGRETHSKPSESLPPHPRAVPSLKTCAAGCNECIRQEHHMTPTPFYPDSAYNVPLSYPPVYPHFMYGASTYGDYGPGYGNEVGNSHMAPMISSNAMVPMMGVPYGTEGPVLGSSFYPSYPYTMVQKQEHNSLPERSSCCTTCRREGTHVHAQPHREYHKSLNSRNAHHSQDVIQGPPTSTISNDVASMGEGYDTNPRKRRISSVDRDYRSTSNGWTKKANVAAPKMHGRLFESEAVTEEPPAKKATRKTSGDEMSKLQSLAQASSSLQRATEATAAKTDGSRTRPTTDPSSPVGTESEDRRLENSTTLDIDNLAVFSSLRMVVWTADNKWEINHCSGPEICAMHGGIIRKGINLFEGVEEAESKKNHPRWESYLIAKRGTLSKRLYWSDGKKFLQVTGPLHDDSRKIVGICGVNLETESA